MDKVGVRMDKVDELKAKGKSLDYIEGFIDGQKDMLKWAMENILETK